MTWSSDFPILPAISPYDRPATDGERGEMAKSAGGARTLLLLGGGERGALRVGSHRIVGCGCVEGS